MVATGMEAALAELHNFPALRTVPREQGVKAVAHALSSLPRPDILRAGAAIRDLAHASDDDACWVTRLLYERAAQGQGPEAATLARVLAGGLSESGSEPTNHHEY